MDPKSGFNKFVTLLVSDLLFSAPTPMNTADKKILIVDNEPELTDLLKTALESMGGFRVHSENDPSRAVAAVSVATLPKVSAVTVLGSPMPGEMV